MVLACVNTVLARAGLWLAVRARVIGLDWTGIFGCFRCVGMGFGVGWDGSGRGVEW